MVALRKESVDRNVKYLYVSYYICMSLSARRAWIEMSGRRQAHTSPAGSLSARRAWIEISRAASCQQRSHVALRKESVDRNLYR